MKRKGLFLFFLTACFTSFAGVENIASETVEEGKEHLTQKGKDKIFTYSKNGARSIIDKVPGGSFFTNWLFDDGESMEDKVDRIDKNEKTSLTKIREVSRKLLTTKRKIEDMWYFQSWILSQGKSLAERLRKSSHKKLLVAILENYLLIPLNPAEYVPNIPPFQKVRESVDASLSLEKGIVTDTKYLLSNTRSALIYSGILKKNPNDFERKYKEAEEYEATLMEAIRAKEKATVKIAYAELWRLQEQIKELEKEQVKEGLSVSDVVALEHLIDKKKETIKKLNEEVDKALKQSTILSEEQKYELRLRKLDQEWEVIKEAHKKEREKRKKG